jgi:excisionase family DNA binding protein
VNKPTQLMMEPHELLSADEVAQLLGVKPTWVYLMAARKEIPSVLVGTRWLARSYRFRRSEIEAWMAANAAQEKRTLL